MAARYREAYAPQIQGGGERGLRHILHIINNNCLRTAFLFPPLSPLPARCQFVDVDIGFSRVNNAALSAWPMIKDRIARRSSRPAVWTSMFFQGRSLSPCNRTRVSLTSLDFTIFSRALSDATKLFFFVSERYRPARCVVCTFRRSSKILTQRVEPLILTAN